jgi:hypothetical protein
VSTIRKGPENCRKAQVQFSFSDKRLRDLTYVLVPARRHPLAARDRRAIGVLGWPVAGCSAHGSVTLRKQSSRGGNTPK